MKNMYVVFLGGKNVNNSNNRKQNLVSGAKVISDKSLAMSIF